MAASNNNRKKSVFMTPLAHLSGHKPTLDIAAR
jgi:hypothetical protein